MYENKRNKNLDTDILVIRSDLNELKKVEKFSLKISKKASLSEDISDNIAIVLTELVNNAILHGNKNQQEKKVTLKAAYFDDRIEISVKDEGDGFDPSLLKDPRDPENIWKDNGRGIFLVRHLIDKAEFFPSSEGTEIVVTEYINN
jgi:serine/threonine-protein kinase RsbW